MHFYLRAFFCCSFNLFSSNFSSSLTVKDQFEGSEANLRRFFDQKSSKFSRILATESQDENGDQLISAGSYDPTEMAILHLLILSKELLFEESTKQLPQVSKTPDAKILILCILMKLLTNGTCNNMLSKRYHLETCLFNGFKKSLSIPNVCNA